MNFKISLVKINMSESLKEFELESSYTPNPYTLLNRYNVEAKILSRAYKQSENYYLGLHKVFTYPLIVLSTISSVLAGLRNEKLEYLLLGLSLATLLCSGFNTAINPKDRQHLANKVSTEFSEISANIKQFIYENHRTNEEVKAYSKHMLTLLEIWKGLSPEIKPIYLQNARLECAMRPIRRSKSERKKQEP